MGFDLTDKNGNEGRIPAWSRGVLAEAVDEYYEHAPVLWYRGDINNSECLKIADALEKAIDDGWFLRDEAIEFEKQWIQRNHNKQAMAISNCKSQIRVAERLISFLRNCGGYFKSI